MTLIDGAVYLFNISPLESRKQARTNSRTFVDCHFASYFI